MRAILAAVLLTVFCVTPASAQVLPCPDGMFDQRDMAGIYIGVDGPMRVQVYPCGGVTVLWDNDYGRHLAFYGAHQRLPGGGVIANGLKPDPSVGYLDNAYTLSVKPAEPGRVQLITVSPYGEFTGFYNLRKV